MSDKLIRSGMLTGEPKEGEKKRRAATNRDQLLDYVIHDLQIVKFQLEKLLDVLSSPFSNLGLDDRGRIERIRELSGAYEIKRPNPDDIECPRCKKKAGWEHLVDAPCGMNGVYMSGSEKYVCRNCGLEVKRKNNIGFDFFYDW